MRIRTAVFASGGGSNLQALIDGARQGGAAEIGLVVSDRAEAGALRRARDAGVPALHVPVRGRPADDVAAETLAALDDHGIGLVALAGYLRLVPARVTSAFRRRMVNIHPALLPAFGGAGMYGERVHAAVLAAGCRVSGATVHWVDEEYDRGGIIAQWPVPVLLQDTPASLAARVLRVEHRLYPAALDAVARALAGEGGGSQAATADVFRLLASIDGIDAEMKVLIGP